MLQKILEKKPYLAWYVADKKSISDQSALEHILSYGDWGDFNAAIKALGIDNIKVLFDQIKTKKRINLKPRTINYFEKYFARHA
jgi:hypothetical protein